ncbi:hypothetical protein LEM8419_03465 [Neolewinella maritima]|uniref:DUF2231 domain-containing protein n=1 Tax=Neolewinella maritima TaxID=1383882 RepID=A0ABM9B5B8_9BACT|nr:DUF2231 domain-containing protein [Neolewinella maritima]CAH1002593.1 hypothetical protein LEM8419_03465 [Neolewinella maritima]
MKYSLLLLLLTIVLPVLGVAQQIEESSVVNASLAEFSNLHPLVVHVPIMLLLLATCTQLATFFIWKEPLDWITLLLLAGGVAGALAASNFTHPHTHGLTPAAQQVLNLHDTYAGWTLGLSVAALVMKGVSLWILRGRRWLEIVVLLAVGGSASTVGMAAHYGGTLVYIHGVGVQGNYMEGQSDPSEE